MFQITHLKKRIPIGIRALIKQITGRDRNYIYSQFGEDAFVSSYFKGKSWNDSESTSLPKNGFYVDIGAYSPTEYSNTRLFYEHGWRGINVDATPDVINAFRLLRRRDVKLNIAIGSSTEDITFYSWGVPCVFNTADATIADERTKVLGAPKKTTVKCMTLGKLLDDYLPVGQHIDFLTVDVEGLDFEVLKSNDWDRYRPELVMAEVYLVELEEIVDSEIYKFMMSQNYACVSWISPTVVFRNRLRKVDSSS